MTFLRAVLTGLLLCVAGMVHAQSFNAIPGSTEAICASAPAVGTLVVGNMSGCPSQAQTKMSAPVVTGTKFTVSGCSIATTVGGAAAGTFVIPSAGACTAVITMGGASAATAPNGWSLAAYDQTTANAVRQTASTTTTATLTVTTTGTSETIVFSATGF